MTSSSDPRLHHWWSWRTTAVLAAVVAIIPLLYPALPPLVDLPGHMGRYRVQLDGNSGPLAAFYAFHWQLIGNLGVDLLIVPMAKLFGLELGVKLIVMAIPALTVTGLLWVAREVHGRIQPTALFALPLAYAHPFLFGFVNFTLAMALALNAFGLWLWLERTRPGWRAAVFAVVAVVLWVTHTFGWAYFCILAFSSELIRQHGRGRGWWRTLIGTGTACLPLLPPLILMAIWRGQGPSGTGGWFDWSAKGFWLRAALRDRYPWYDMASLAVIALLPIVAALHPRMTLSRRMLLCTVILAIAFCLLPRVVFGSAYADMRLAPYIFAIAVLAVRLKHGASRRLISALAVVGIAFFAMRIATTTVSLAETARSQQRSLAALDRVPVGARLINFTGTACARPWLLDRNWHLGGMAMVQRRAFSNDQWAVTLSSPMTIEKYDAGRFANDPSQMVAVDSCRRRGVQPISRALATFPRAAFDYVWLIDAPPFDSAAAADLQLMWRDGENYLFRVNRP